MPHKCLRCGRIFADDDPAILHGCPYCGSVFFLYFKTKEDLKRIERVEKKLEKKKTSLEKEITKKFELETIRSPREGVYEINIEALMKKKPIIILEKEMVYIIHLPSIFQKVK